MGTERKTRPPLGHLAPATHHPHVTYLMNRRTIRLRCRAWCIHKYRAVSAVFVVSGGSKSAWRTETDATTPLGCAVQDCETQSRAAPE